MILVQVELFGEFLVPTMVRVRIDFDRDFLSGTTVALAPERTVADAAEDALRHHNHPLS